jgi:hypothetical protein
MAFASLKGDWDSSPDAEGSSFVLRSGSGAGEGLMFEMDGAIALAESMAPSCGKGTGILEPFCSGRLRLDWAGCCAGLRER